MAALSALGWRKKRHAPRSPAVSVQIDGHGLREGTGAYWSCGSTTLLIA